MVADRLQTVSATGIGALDGFIPVAVLTRIIVEWLGHFTALRGGDFAEVFVRRQTVLHLTKGVVALYFLITPSLSFRQHIDNGKGAAMPRKTRMYLPGIPAHVVVAPGILPLTTLVRPAHRNTVTTATPVF
jgi:hypothetical protein